MNTTHLNHVIVIGRLHGDLRSYSIDTGETFFDGIVVVQRQSGTADYLPISIPAALFDDASDVFNLHGRVLRLIGEIRTYNRLIADKSRHYTVLFVKQIAGESAEATDGNNVELEGVICRPPVYRETPFGREICDFIIAVNRRYGRNSYIPCIAWGLTARKVSTLAVGTTVSLTGRFQSREYRKKLDNGQEETRMTHEVSCKRVNIVKQEEAEA